MLISKIRLKEARAGLLALSLALAVAGCATGFQGAKTYRNPLVTDHHHDLADPDVLEDGGKYYLYPTSDGRGYEVFVSKDLVNWKKEARVLEIDGASNRGRSQSSSLCEGLLCRKWRHAQ